MAVKVFDPEEIRKTIHVLKPEGSLFELRCHETNGRIHSGYFCQADAAIDRLRTLNLTSGNVYITLNRIKDSCYFAGAERTLCDECQADYRRFGY